MTTAKDTKKKKTTTTTSQEVVNKNESIDKNDLLASDGLVMKIATSILDKDKDGDIKDDLLDMAMGFVSGKVNGKK